MDELVLSIAASESMNMFLGFFSGLRSELCQHKGKPKDALRHKS